jgi:hypothetical protein
MPGRGFFFMRERGIGLRAQKKGPAEAGPFPSLTGHFRRHWQSVLLLYLSNAEAKLFALVANVPFFA